jgi:hypothetical protein
MYVTNSVAPESEGSSPRSKQPVTGLYTESIESTPPHANLHKIHSPIYA